MEALILFILPIIAGICSYFLKGEMKKILTITTVVILSITSLKLFINFESNISFDLGGLNFLVVALDYVLLLFFLKEAKKHENILVGSLAIFQLILLTFLLFNAPHEENVSNLIIDRLSSFMFVLINIVGGVIVIYGLKYIEDEDTTEERKSFFIATLFIFLAVMNLIVSANNIEWFFLLFELTTLASYILIGFRKDEISTNNALRALWINQIGGVAILFALIFFSLYYSSIYFDKVLEIKDYVTLLPFALLSLSALIKGAQFPAQSWLLGAMVAPTPVSAILHSATMVKIAPFLILKLSPAISNTFIAKALLLIGGFSFLIASILALNSKMLKELFAYSTIALLGLMILLASIGTNLALIASMALIFFHGVSKALLFLEAGVLERVFHLKEIEKMDNLITKAPLTTFFMLFGLISITLPPFGAFIAKWMAIEVNSNVLRDNIFNLFAIITIILGSVVLALLYFKFSAKIVQKQGDLEDSFKLEKLPLNYLLTTGTLVALIALGGFFIAPIIANLIAPIATSLTNIQAEIYSKNWSLYFHFSSLEFYQIVLAFLLLFLAPLLSYFVKFKNVDRVREYSCGERLNLSFGLYYFELSNKNHKRLNAVAFFLFVILILGAI